MGKPVLSSASEAPQKKLRVVVIGNGMVGHRFCEELLEKDKETQRFTLTVFGEETRPAYNRMLLTQFFEHRDAEQLSLLSHASWFVDNQVDAFIAERVVGIDTER